MQTALPLLNLWCLICFLPHRVYSLTPTGYKSVPIFCCNPQPGPRVQVTPYDLDEIVNESPYYEVIATSTFYNKDLDNVCHTYFPMGDSSYLRITILTYANSSVIIEKYIYARLTGYPGVDRIQGLALDIGSSSVVFDDAFLGSPCPGLNVYYKKYIAGSCNVLFDEIKDGADLRHGDATTRGISDYCATRFVALANSQSFNGSTIVKYPFKLNCNCVTKLNGISCVNADRVRPQDSITLP